MALIIIKIFRRIARSFVLLSLNFCCIIRLPRIKSRLFGTKYGNWRLPIDTKSTSNDYIFSGGVGEDISFEQQAIDEFGEIKVVLYDFTPRALSHLRSLFEFEEVSDKVYASRNQIKFYNFGLSDSTGNIEVIYPSNPSHVSLRRVTDVEATGVLESLPVLSAKEEIQKIDTKQRFILKFDIEGSEAELLASRATLSSMATFQIILLELDFLKFDDFLNWYAPIKWIFQLLYTHRLYYVDDFNIGLIKK